ncbi:MAG: hypothetical protein RML37_12025 [Chitinophagales bacterium]|nr:hypothetical protein [Chitinophagales bacterium]
MSAITYHLTKHTFNGHIALTYVDGRLECIDTREAALDDERHRWVHSRAPLRADELPKFCAAAGFICTEVTDEVTFEAFYNAYGYKEGRKKAEAAWNRLSKAEQWKAYRYIPRIKAKKQLSGEALPYPATYLNQKRWED